MSHSTRHLLHVLLLTALASAALAGCIGAPPPEAPAPAPVAEPATATPCDPAAPAVPLGFIGALEGEGTDWDATLAAIARQYVTERNAEGGVRGRCLALHAEDLAGGSEEGVRAAAERLAAAGVRAMLGATSSSEVEVLLPILTQERIVLVSPAATRPSLAGVSPYFFRTIPSDAVQGPSQASWAYNYLGARQAVVLYQDSTYASGLKDSFVAGFTRLGGKIAAEPMEFTTGAFDAYDATAASAASLAPPLVVVQGWDPESTEMMKALRAAGYAGRILTSEAFEYDSSLEHGGDAVEGVYFTKPAPDPDNRGYSEYLSRYPDYSYGAHTFDAAHVLVETLEAVGPDASADEMRAHLVRTSFDGTASAPSLYFNEKGDLTSGGYFLWWVKDGAFAPAPEAPQ